MAAPVKHETPPDRFRLTNGHHVLEMDLLSIETDVSLPSYGDAVLWIHAASHGYTGQSRAWVFKEALSNFCSSLLHLERTLEGEATLASISPNKLALRVFAVSSRGHLAVEGSTGYHVHDSNRTYWHAVSFGFEFEPSQLSEARRRSWITHHKS
jgi:hypothetical protein